MQQQLRPSLTLNHQNHHTRIAAERVAEGILDQEHRAAKVRAATYGTCVRR